MSNKTKTIKVVVNRCWGTFMLSKKAYEFLGLEWDGYGFDYIDGDRTDPKLVACVETLGAEANGELAQLEIVEVPADVKWTITSNDGYEFVEEVHRIW